MFGFFGNKQTEPSEPSEPSEQNYTIEVTASARDLLRKRKKLTRCLQ